MKKSAGFILLYIGWSFCGFGKNSPLLFTEKNNSFLQLLTAGKQHYCIAGNTIYRLTKKGLEKKAVFDFTCTDAVAYKDNIAFATGNGIRLFNTRTSSVTAYLPQLVNGAINHIQTDAGNHIWFTKEFEGCYTIGDSNKLLQKIKVPVTYSLAYTTDNTMWIGTNVGLYKISLSGNKIERYAEEGIASNDLPDNLVEQLFPDSKKSLWVVMPGHISFIAPNSNDEFPDYEFIGSKDNELYHIACIDSLRSIYLFSTRQGVLLIHNITSGEDMRTGEIHQTITEKAYLLTDTLIEKQEMLRTEKVKMIKTIGGTVYFVTDRGLWGMNSLKLKKKLKKKFSI